ncbi:MAG: RHS repeat protein, partial [Burkholderiaceae bacterium]|nr:RHS repeat protein [Burkholderiaceae bacterium]
DYGKATVLHWDTKNGATIETLLSSKAPLESRQWYVHAGNTDITARVLPDGGTQASTTVRNEQGNPLLQTDPLGRQTKITYAANGIDPIKVEQKSAGGWDSLAQLTWNQQHRLLAIKNAAGQTTKYSYNSAGQLTARTGPNNLSTRYQYDQQGQLSRIINAAGRPQASYQYDRQGNLASSSDSEGYTVKHEYDALNRITQASYPDGTRTEI